jgi:glyoxylase-like metal-dependent hydrolase (beta-lactamase superfamily II)
MEIKIIPAGIYDANCYVLVDNDTKDCAIIDPGGDAEVIINKIKSLGVKVNFVLLTHGHADHTGGVKEIRNEFKCPVYINKKDYEIIRLGESIFGNMAENGDAFIKDGEELSFGNIKIKCIETPGHTPGGMCYLIDGKLFTGDTLFYGSVGRTDFAYGNFDMLQTSIKSKLFTLSEDTLAFPGHGPKTSIGFEKENNPFV